MTFQTKVQALIGAGGADLTQCTVDWGRSRVFQAGAGKVGRVGLLTGALEAQALTSSYGVNTVSGAPIGLDALGNGYLVSPGTFNFGGVAQFAGDDLSLIQQWGVSASGDNRPAGINQPGGFANVVRSNTQFMLAQGVGGIESFLEDLNVLKGPQFAGRTIPTASSCDLCTGMPDTGQGWVLAGPETALIVPQQLQLICVTITSNASLWVPSDWPTQNPAINGANIGAPILPTDVDASWGVILENGICLDQTDGNILAAVSGGVTLPTDNYVLKISAVTGAILWKVHTAGSGAGKMMRFSDIRHQRLAQITGGGSPSGQRLTIIDTSTGAASVQDTGLTGLPLIGSGAYSNSLGCMVTAGSYSNEGQPDSPLPLGTTPDSFTNWMALYLAPPVSGPPSVTPGSVRIWGNYP